MFTGYHQEARLGFRRRKPSAVRLCPLEQKGSVPDSAVLSLHMPTRSSSKGGVPDSSILRLPTPMRSRSKDSIPDSAVLRLPTPMRSRSKDSVPDSAILSLNTPTRASSINQQLQRAEPELVLETQSAVPAEPGAARPQKEPEDITLCEISLHPTGQETVSLSVDTSVEITDDADHEKLLGSQPEVGHGIVWERMEDEHARRAEEEVKKAEEEAKRAEAKAKARAAGTEARKRAEAAKKSRNEKTAVPSTNAGSPLLVKTDAELLTPLPMADLQSIKQRVAKGVYEVAHDGQLGAVLKAATDSQATHNVDEDMQQDRELAHENVFLPVGNSSVDHCISMDVEKNSFESSGMSFLDRLRKQAATKFLAAAQSDELRSALHVVTNPTGNKLVPQNQDTQDVSISHINANDSLAEFGETTAHVQHDRANDDPAGRVELQESSLLQMLRQQAMLGVTAAARAGELGSILQDASNPTGRVELEEPSLLLEEPNLLQLLRQRAMLGVTAAARAGDLGSILQSASGSPRQKIASKATPAVSCKMPPRTPSMTPKIPKSASSTSLSQGGATKRQSIPVPTGLPTPSGDCAPIKSAAGRPGAFRRRHSRAPSKMISFE